MDTNIFTYRISETTCYICGSKDIWTICHHCKRAMCNEHGPHQTLKGNIIRRNTDVEFSKLNLYKFLDSENAVHCEYCNHYVTSIRWTPFFIFCLLFCFRVAMVTPSKTLKSICVFLCFLFTLIIMYRLYKHSQWQQQELQKHKPPLPILAQFISIDVHEGLEGEIFINQVGDYKSQVVQGSPRGIIKISSSFNEDDFERLLEYQKKYQLYYSTDVIFNAGYLVPAIRNMEFTRGRDAIIRLNLCDIS